MSDMIISVRRYRPEDLDAVIDIFLRAIRDTASADYNPDQIAAWARADRDLWATRRLSHPTWIAEVSGRPAGFTDLEDDGHLDMMYVHPDFGGCGVATQLVRTAEHHATSRGISKIYSEVSLTARRFFERMGFVVVAPENVFRNGQWFTRFKMEKLISDRTSLSDGTEQGSA